VVFGFVCELEEVLGDRSEASTSVGDRWYDVPSPGIDGVPAIVVKGFVSRKLVIVRMCEEGIDGDAEIDASLSLTHTAQT
jgi:hypothetical protein